VFQSSRGGKPHAADAGSTLQRVAQAEGYLLDLDGCLVLRDDAGETAGQALPGAAELIGELRRRGLPFLCCTNASGKPPGGYAASLRVLGLEIEDRQMLTPPAVAAEHISRTRPDAHVMVLGGEGVTIPLVEAGIHVATPTHAARADIVLVGPVRELKARDLQAAADAIRAGAAFMVTSYVPLIPKRSGSVASVSAAIGAGIAHVTGIDPIVMGKPSTIVMEVVQRRLRLNAGEIAVVGDDPALETELGRRAGSMTALVLSGITTADEVQRLPETRRPDVVLSGVDELCALLRRVPA
jgi:HAD superfamily hydrolase (TIGR01450 family)